MPEQRYLTTCAEIRDYYRPVPMCWHGWKPSQCPVSLECRLTDTEETETEIWERKPR